MTPAAPSQHDVHWEAQWIWGEKPQAPINAYLAARKIFEPQPQTLDQPRRLHITADSRYRVWLNGQWLGNGPGRNFASRQQFDTYDVTGLVQPGRNLLAVLAYHFGEGNFQYNPSAAAGLLAQLERRQGEDWRCEVISDATWSVTPHAGYASNSPRISCQMGFVEMFDAQAMAPEWTQSKSKITGFKPARVLGPVGCAPWEQLTPRPTPLLTRTPRLPVRIWRTGLVQCANVYLGFNARRALLAPGFLAQSEQALRGFAATRILSPVEQELELFNTNWRYEWPLVNGEAAGPDRKVLLRKGENLCVIPFAPHPNHMEYHRSYAGVCDEPVELSGLFNDKSPWSVFGPFDDWDALYPQLLKVQSAQELIPYRDAAKALGQEDIFAHGSPWCETTAARTIAGQPVIHDVQSLLNDSPQSTVIEPSPLGDVEVFLDFGRELVGYTSLDLHAPAGTVLDFNFLEEIEDGKRIHYTSENECSMRYVTREGRQQYLSFQRRGYRYIKLVLRRMSAPVQLFSVQTLLATYPSQERGAFTCSDPLLTRIWEVGRHTLRCCSEDTFTDCPTYEQTFWVGDARNEALVNYACYGDAPLTRHCALLPAESLERSPMPESQTPSAWPNLIPAWSFLWVQTVLEHWLWSGDRAYLKQVYPAVLSTLHNCREKLSDERGLLAIKAWNFFDWAGIDYNHRVVTHNQILLAQAYQCGAQLAEVLNKKRDAQWMLTQRIALVEAINKHLWSPKKQAYIDAIHDDGAPSAQASQQVNTLALLYDIAQGRRAQSLRRLLDQPDPGMTGVGSPFALFYILEALIKEGRHVQSLELIREHWGAMVRHGATSFWETFPQAGSTWRTRSCCHAWSAAPVYFLSRYQLGAWWKAPGYTHAHIEPVTLDLSWASGQVPTPTGQIEVAWEKRSDRFQLEVSLPADCGATLVLPVKAKEFPNIQHSAGLRPRRVGGRWQTELGRGASAILTALR